MLSESHPQRYHYSVTSLGKYDALVVVFSCVLTFRAQRKEFRCQRNLGYHLYKIELWIFGRYR